MSAYLLVMCRGNINDFYSTARLNNCLGYLLNNACYASLAVILTHSMTFFVLQSLIVADV